MEGRVKTISRMGNKSLLCALSGNKWLKPLWFITRKLEKKKEILFSKETKNKQKMTRSLGRPQREIEYSFRMVEVT